MNVRHLTISIGIVLVLVGAFSRAVRRKFR